MDASEAVEEVIVRLVSAWNSKDEPCFCALFTKEARYTGTDGVLREGRAGIGALLREQPPHGRVSIDEPISIDRLGSRAFVKFRWRSVPSKQGRSGVIDCVLLLESDSWRIDELVNVAQAD